MPWYLQFLKEELSRIDESWAAARFDSLPHVVHILTSKDREGDVKVLKEQSDIIEEVVDEVVHAYHSGFNKAIQNYSQVSLQLYFGFLFCQLLSVNVYFLLELVLVSANYFPSTYIVDSLLQLVFCTFLCFLFY